MKNFYLTTTLPYVNADPHIGFALEMVQADAIARWQRILGNQVIFNTGTDEHGLKIYQKALAEKKEPLAYCDEYAAKFDALKQALDLTYDHFIRTTNPKHMVAAQEFWRRCQKNGYIYLDKYKTKYCVGCELEKTDSELVDEHCPIHPNREIEIIEEENFFFKFSSFQDKLMKFYKENSDFVLPTYRYQEIKSFVARGLNDFSISRLKEKMPWGIPVPDYPDHVMYVWFDALINYISTLGWPEKNSQYQNFWPGIQVAGKDNLRQQTTMWQAMLMAADLPNSKQVFIHGFITAEGQKMSKSLGNVVNPFDLIKKYGTEAVRYYLLREIPDNSDGDFSENRMKEIYNSELANELGNLVSRITTLAQNDNLTVKPAEKNQNDSSRITFHLNNFQFNEAIHFLWKKIKDLNAQTNQESPWNKKPTDRLFFLTKALTELNNLGTLFEPFLPKTAQIIKQSTQGKIKKITPLFPRLN